MSHFSSEDEKNILVFYLEKMINIIEARFKEHNRYVVLSSAAALMRRFYLKQTLLECDAGRMMWTCVILGAKLAEVNIDVKSYLKAAKEINVTRKKIKNYQKIDKSGLKDSLSWSRTYYHR